MEYLSVAIMQARVRARLELNSKSQLNRKFGGGEAVTPPLSSSSGGLVPMTEHIFTWRLEARETQPGKRLVRHRVDLIIGA
jgi:hypothetical protein